MIAFRLKGFVVDEEAIKLASEIKKPIVVNINKNIVTLE